MNINDVDIGGQSMCTLVKPLIFMKVVIAIKNMTWHVGTSINVDFHEGCNCGGKVMTRKPSDIF